MPSRKKLSRSMDKTHQAEEHVKGTADEECLPCIPCWGREQMQNNCFSFHSELDCKVMELAPMPEVLTLKENRYDWPVHHSPKDTAHKIGWAQT